MRYAILVPVNAIYLALILTTSSALAQDPAGNGLKSDCGVFHDCIVDNHVSFDGHDVRFLLAKVIGPPTVVKNEANSIVTTYETSAILEYRHAIAADTKIVVEDESSQGSGPDPMPSVWTRGDVIAIAIATTGNPQKYLYAGQARLIGLSTPCAVRQQDLASIETAMLKLGEISRTDSCVLTAEDALKLLRVKDNYFLWALGISNVAARNDHAAMDLLSSLLYADRTKLLAPRQVVWIMRCINQYFSEEIKPGFPSRTSTLLRYLERLDPVAPAPHE